MQLQRVGAIYNRVSTDEQAEHGRGLVGQLQDNRDYNRRHNIVAPPEYEINDDISGTTMMRDRPGGARVLELIEGKKIGALTVHMADRIGRDLFNVNLGLLCQACAANGVDLHLWDRGKIDLVDPWGTLMATIDSKGAARYRLDLIKRSRDGRLNKARDGLWVGEGAPPFGYRRVGWRKQSALEIDPAEAGTVRLIFAMLLGRDGQKPHSTRAIVESLQRQGIKTPGSSRESGKRNHRGWHTRTVNLILRRSLYAGVLTYKGIQKPAPGLAIIDGDTWNAAQDRLAANSNRNRRSKRYEYLLAQHIRCSCGRAMIGKYKGSERRRYFYYDCAGKSLPSHLRNCNEAFVSADSIEPEMWAWVERLITNEEVLVSAIDARFARDQATTKPRQERLAALVAERDRCDRSIHVWVGQYDGAGDTELKALKQQVRDAEARLNLIRADIEAIEHELAGAAAATASRDSVVAAARAYRDRIHSADFATRRHILDRFNAMAKLFRVNDSRRAELSLSVGDWAVTTTALQNALPATHARCCDTRPAPKSRACRCG